MPSQNTSDIAYGLPGDCTERNISGPADCVEKSMSKFFEDTDSGYEDYCGATANCRGVGVEDPARFIRLFSESEGRDMAWELSHFATAKTTDAEKVQWMNAWAGAMQNAYAKFVASNGNSVK